MKGKVKNMTDIRNILHRLRQGESTRRIHRELCVHRSIIRQIHELAVVNQWLDPNRPMPDDTEISHVWNHTPKQKFHSLDPHKDQIERWHNEGKSSVVIHQLLKGTCSCSAQSIGRYRKKHFPKAVEPIMVRSTVPGRDMDVDFGELGIFYDDNNEPRKVWLFSLRLRHSRKVYREIVLDQQASTFLMGHVHAFEYFGGVPAYCVLDNLKAGVIRSTIDNEMINRSFQALAEHYGFIISPCNPYTPEHKGGVENDVKYAKKNFLQVFLEKQKQMGCDKPKIRDLAEALKKWDKEVADCRIVYGVGRSPFEIFKSEEEKALRPLPRDRWEPSSWKKSEVRRDWRVMVENAYYSVPYKLIGYTVEVCITPFLVRIFHENKEVALHERATEKWDYKRKSEHAPPFQEAVLQCSREGLLVLAKDIGSYTFQVVQIILSHPTIDKLKPARHLLKLAEKYSKKRLEDACSRAFNCKLFNYNSIKSILEKELDSQPIETSKSNKVVPMSSYRFARNSADYCPDEKPKTFEEKLIEQHPFSKYGNGIFGPVLGLMFDQMDEDGEI